MNVSSIPLLLLLTRGFESEVNRFVSYAAKEKTNMQIFSKHRNIESKQKKRGQIGKRSRVIWQCGNKRGYTIRLQLAATADSINCENSPVLFVFSYHVTSGDCYSK